MKLLVKEIGQLVTVCEGKRFLAGAEMANITVRTGCLALAVDDLGKIAMVGSENLGRKHRSWERAAHNRERERESWRSGDVMVD